MGRAHGHATHPTLRKKPHDKNCVLQSGASASSFRRTHAPLRLDALRRQRLPHPAQRADAAVRRGADALQELLLVLAQPAGLRVEHGAAAGDGTRTTADGKHERVAHALSVCLFVRMHSLPTLTPCSLSVYSHVPTHRPLSLSLSLPHPLSYRSSASGTFFESANARPHTVRPGNDAQRHSEAVAATQTQ